MEAPLFYVPPDKITGDSIDLPAAEARHATKVLRMRKGDAAVVVDGCGMAYRGILEKAGPKGGIIAVHQTVRNLGEPLVKLTLAAGLSTADKFDTVVQKATELGVSRIVPLTCSRAKVKVDDPKRAESKRKRLLKVAVAAMKQCRRSVCPAIEAPTPVGDFLSEAAAYESAIVFDPRPAHQPLDAVLDRRGIRRIAVLVGPESGLSGEEVSAAQSAGFSPVSLGARILRTETAAPVACALVMSALDELN